MASTRDHKKAIDIAEALAMPEGEGIEFDPQPLGKLKLERLDLSQADLEHIAEVLTSPPEPNDALKHALERRRKLLQTKKDH